MGDDGASGRAQDDAELRSHLAAIVESSADAIIGKTLDGVITSWNAGATDMYGYAASEMIGRNISVLFPPDRADELAPILQRLRRGERVGHFETKRVRKDGTIAEVSVAVSPIRDASGTVTGAATVARDITEHNHAAAERRAHEAQMHQAERMETVGQLAGGIAHDFNNLLGAIMGFAQLAAEEAADRPALRSDVEQILSAAVRAAGLTRELLIFSRREPDQPERADLNEIITGIRSLLAASVGQHITQRFELAPDLPAVLADRGRVEQLLLNLSVNARDAMPDGGTLTIATRDTELAQRSARALGTEIAPGCYTEVTVGDTGTGMSPEVVRHIFEPFFTTKHPTTAPAWACPPCTASSPRQAARSASTQRKAPEPRSMCTSQPSACLHSQHPPRPPARQVPKGAGRWSWSLMTSPPCCRPPPGSCAEMATPRWRPVPVSMRCRCCRPMTSSAWSGWAWTAAICAAISSAACRNCGAVVALGVCRRPPSPRCHSPNGWCCAWWPRRRGTDSPLPGCWARAAVWARCGACPSRSSTAPCSAWSTSVSSRRSDWRPRVRGRSGHSWT